MEYGFDNNTQGATPASGADASSATAPLAWKDGQGRMWRVELEPGLVRLVSAETTVELPAGQWAQDVYAAPHGSGFIIRIETYDEAFGFLVPAESARPFLSHIGRTERGEEPEPVRNEARGDEPLLWPKVSPLAVWALITSALVFVPVLGLLAAAVTTVLLVLHRGSVRRSRAYAHSRTLCRSALVLLALGLIVSGLGTRTAVLNWAATSVESRRPAVFERLEGSAAPASEVRSALGRGRSSDRALIAAVWDEEHNWGLIAAALLVVLLSLTVHEAAHAISAWWLGDDFARRLGRVTLNPMAHIDPIGTVLLPLILFLAGTGVFGWARPVPVRVENCVRPRRAHILIAIAGPGSNLLLASVSLMLLIGTVNVIALVAPGASLTNLTTFDFTQVVTASGLAGARLIGPLCTVLKLSFIVNVFLAFFNLIPIPPLDGSWVLEHMFPQSLGRLYANVRPYSLLLFLGLIYTNVLKYLLLPGILALAVGLILLEMCTPA